MVYQMHQFILNKYIKIHFFSIVYFVNKSQENTSKLCPWYFILLSFKILMSLNFILQIWVATLLVILINQKE